MNFYTYLKTKKLEMSRARYRKVFSNTNILEHKLSRFMVAFTRYLNYNWNLSCNICNMYILFDTKREGE